MSKFEKVSFEQFLKDCKSLETSGALWFADDEKIREIYDAIKLPRRATDGSAGYDFYMPFTGSFIKEVPVMIPTGIRVLLDHGTFLMCVPRSGLGFKYGMALRNTVGVIDEDYSNSDNEGHIMAMMTTENSVLLPTGDRFMQGIIVRYATTEDDDPIKRNRNGGFGSTGGAGQIEGQMSVDDFLKEDK